MTPISIETEGLPPILILTESTREPAGGHGPALRYWGSALRTLSSFDIRVIFGTIGADGPVHQLANEIGHRSFALHSINKFTFPRAILDLRKIIKDNEVRIAHFSEPLPAALGEIAVGRENTRWIFHRHHIRLPGVVGWLGARASRNAGLTIAVSDAVRRAAQVDGAQADRVKVVHNGVVDLQQETAQAWSIRGRLSLSQASRILVVPGRLRPEKGHAMLLEGWARSNCEAQGAHLIIVGDGPERENLVALCNQHDLRNVHLVGHKDAIAGWIADADLVVIPSLAEPFGLVAIEAMSLSRPILASRTGGLTEILEDNHTGILVASGSAAEFGEALTKALSRGDLESIGRSARRVYEERFTMEAMVDGWVTCWKTLETGR